MQINNDGAIKFYEDFGFEIVEEKKNYYKRIEPADAYVLQKSFGKGKPRVNGTTSVDDSSYELTEPSWL